ncbi:hypothetical protein FF021_19665 [Leptospira noguchii]|nr:hypothetical protein FF021_19665 [Leptospira noguchii]
MCVFEPSDSKILFNLWVGYGSERCVELLRTHRSLSRYTELTLKECEFDVRGIYFSEKSWDPNFMD